MATAMATATATAEATAEAEAARPLDRSATVRRFEPVMRKVRACYRKELANRPGLSGTVSVTLTVAGGRVTAAALTPSPVRSPSFDACATTGLVGLSLPEASELTTVQIPFVFHAQ
jgi:hypothetical protein